MENLPRQTVVANRWDRKTYTESVRPMPAVDGLIDDLMIGADPRPAYDMAPELVQDAFMALYQPAPVVRGPKEVDPEVRCVQTLMTKLIEHPALNELQEYTSGDALLSAVAMGQMGDVLRKVIEEAAKREEEQQKRKKEREEQQKQQGSGPGGTPGGPGDDDQENEGPGGGPGGNGDDPSDEPAEDPGNDPGDGEVDWEQMLEDMDVERMLHRAMEKAKDEAEELEAVVKSFGFEPGEWQAMDPSERLKMAKRFENPAMKRLAEMIGRMVRYAFGVKQTRIIDVPHIVYDVERGNNLRNVLPREYAIMGQGGGARLDFFRRYASRDLAQYRKKGEEKAGRGPLVVCIDKSGSMHGAPFDWAMGAAEAMRRLVADEGRDYHAIFFGGRGDLHRFDFPKGQASGEKVLAFCSVVADGGTAFEEPLAEALKRASESFDASGTTKADVVFITDGESAVSEKWLATFNEERARVGVRVYSIYINGAYDASTYSGQRARKLLESFSDQVISVHDLTPEAVEQVFVRL